jgi:hypothetical protein
VTVLLGFVVAGLTVGGTVVGVLGCRGHGLRSWVVHVGVSAVMVGMVLPVFSSSLTVGASFLSAAALLTLLVWTTLEGRRTRSSGARRLNSARELTDLAAMSVLVLVMPSSMVHGEVSLVASASMHTGHLGPAISAPSMSGLILALWFISLAFVGFRVQRTLRLNSTSSLHGVAGSALMLSGMAAMTMLTSTV